MATPPETIETPEVEEAGRPGRRMILVIAAVAVVLLATVYFLFLRGGEEPAPPPDPAPAPAAESPSPAETDRGRKPVETFEVFAPKDPFEPAVVAQAPANGGGGATPGPGGGEPTPGDGTVPDRGGRGREETIGGHRVRLVDAFPNGRRAQIQVDGVVYTVDEGEEFASNFRLISVSGRCATMLFGDDEFTLCEGEEVLK